MHPSLFGEANGLANRVRTLGWLWLLLGLLGPSYPCLGDGKVFAPVGTVRAETPSQRALIHWQEGIETLVVETTVQSEASELGWVLPLPSAPLSVRPADPGLFPTLQNLFQPRVEFEKDWGWLGGAAAGLGIFLIRWRVQRKISVTLSDALVVVGFVVILSMMLLPSLAKAKGGIAQTTDPRLRGSDVHVVSELRAGVFDVITLRATQSGALAEWLGSHGLAVPTDMAPVVQDYLDRGWVFVAAQVRNPTPGSLTALHPLVFRFAAKEAVYPMRLTGVGASSLDCDLYVFGPGRAGAQGWNVRYCGVPDFSARSYPAMTPFPLRIRHEELLSIVSGSIGATKLSAQLSADGLSRDVTFRWQPVRPVGQILRTWSSALTRALFPVGWMLALTATLGCLSPGRRGITPPWFSTIDRVGVGVAVVTGFIVWLMIPRAPAEQIETLPRRASSDLRHALMALAADSYDLPKMQAVLQLPSFEERSNALSTARSALVAFLRTNLPAPSHPTDPARLINPFTGGRIRMERSPGNMDLEPTAEGFDLVWYDFDGVAGQRHEIPSPSAAASDRRAVSPPAGPR